jgi:hypothetical protein
VNLLRENNQIIYEQDSLIHDVSQDISSISLNLTRLDFSHSIQPSNNTKFIAKAFFNQIYRNSSTVYLHAVVSKKLDDSKASSNPANQRLHGVVKMIKYDLIPKHFHHRYLLSDFDLVQLTDDESKQQIPLPLASIVYSLYYSSF